MAEQRAFDEVVVLDFETTGLTTDYDRVIEVGAALVKGDEIVDTFSALCDPGTPIPSFITSLTGITTAMVKGQPTPESVMREFYYFIGDRPILAHNASFDSRFLNAEMSRVDLTPENPTLCTMLLARRLIHDATDHKLGTLKRYINFQTEAGHKDHRALDDVKVTVALWIHLRDVLEELTGTREHDISTYQKLSRISKNKLKSELEKLSRQFA
ncbi:MAG: DNA polymerase-3 subunit epsilon [Chlamydiales bacterium]|jgi:DNA polymerase-3 subunit epsilon